MKELIILVGPAGAGKSTMCKEIFPKHVRINQDDQGKDHLNLFHVALEDECNIVVDRMNFNRQQRNRYLIPAKELGYTTRIVVLHESYDTCLERMLKREGHPTVNDSSPLTKKFNVGSELEKNTKEYKARAALKTFFTNYERPQEGEADDIQFIYPAGPKPKAIICDIDNTLSDANHRQAALSRENGKKPNWREFFSKMGKDPVNEWCADILKAFTFGNLHKVILTSARPEEYREVTEKWLRDNAIPYDELIMRYQGDHRKDDLVKEMLYDFNIQTKYEVSFWIDDRKQVIEKIRSRGIIVLDCAGPKGDF